MSSFGRRGKDGLLTVLLMVSFANWFPCSPRQSPETLQKIQTLIQQGNTASAQLLLSQLLKQFPSNPDLYNLQGAVMAQEGNFAGSEASFRQAIKLAPGFPDAYLNLGRLYQERIPKDGAARDKAIDAYAHLLRVDPGNLEANYQAAFLLMQKGLYQDSLQHLSRLPTNAQERAQALSVRCGDYAGLGAEQKAEEAGEKMMQSSELAEVDVLTILPVFAKHKNTLLSIRSLEGLERRHLASFQSLYDLGFLYEQQGRHDDARQTLEQAAELQPNSVSLLLELAKVANHQKDYTGALGYLAHARDLDPNNAAIHYLWGMVCVEEDLAEEAYQALKKAVSLDPQNPDYNYALGGVALERTDASEAVPYFQKYCELKPRDPRGRLALGTAYFSSNDFDKAEKIITPLVRDPVTTATAHYYLGRIANRKGDYTKATQDLQLAIKTDPSYTAAYAELGLVYLKQKEYPQAEDAFQKALKLNPDNYTANLNLLILYQRTRDPKEVEQAERFKKVNEQREQRGKDSLRTIEVRP